jgi:hypothetical protein
MVHSALLKKTRPQKFRMAMTLAKKVMSGLMSCFLVFPAVPVDLRAQSTQPGQSVLSDRLPLMRAPKATVATRNKRSRSTDTSI